MNKIKSISIIHILTIIVFVTLTNSCKNDLCIEYELRDNYSLRNNVTDAETFEKENNLYVDNNDFSLDNSYDSANLFLLRDTNSYFKNRIHSNIGFKENLVGEFLDGDNNINLSFEYNYIQDSVVIVESTNSYNYKFYLNDDCKLEHCVYLVSTFKTSPFKDYEIIYSTYCLDKSFSDVANEYRQLPDSETYDTIGISRFTMFEE